MICTCCGKVAEDTSRVTVEDLPIYWCKCRCKKGFHWFTTKTLPPPMARPKPLPALKKKFVKRYK